MSKWCYANYVFEGSKEDISALHNILLAVKNSDESLVPNGYGKMWIGNVAHLLEGDLETMSLRGDFDNIELNTPTMLSFTTETAWGEENDVWNAACSRFRSLKYFWMAEESGSGYFATNDKDGTYYSDRYIVEQTNHSPEYYETLVGVFMDLSERLEQEISDWDKMRELIGTFNQANEDDQISVHEVIIKE